MFLNRCAKVFGVEVCIYLGSENAFMSQQLLYLANTGSTLQKMGSKGVA